MGIWAIGAILALALAAVLGVQIWHRKRRIRRRLRPILHLLAAPTSEPVPIHVEVQRTRHDNSMLSRLGARYPLTGGVRTTLIAASAGLLAFALTFPSLTFFEIPSIPGLMLSALLAFAVGWNLGAGLENMKREEYAKRLLIVLEDYHRMVRFGISTTQALRSVASAASEPVKSSLRNIVLEVDLGVPVGMAMEHEARRIRISELSMLAAVVATQSSTGGNLSESVDNLAIMLRERLDNRSRMKASTAEARVTLIILALVPFAGIGLQVTTKPEMLDVLFADAKHLLGIGVLLILTGLVVSWLMIRSTLR